MQKRRNLLVVTITLILMSISLAGCAGEDHESKDIKEDEKEEIVYESVSPLILIKKEKIEGAGCKQYIYYDPETLVMYSHFTDVNDCGMHEMHNSDGTPRLYDEKVDVKPLEFIAKEKIVDAGCTEYMYFDPETLVMYVHYTNINDKGLSEMHNSDGSLRTYNPKK